MGMLKLSENRTILYAHVKRGGIGMATSLAINKFPWLDVSTLQLVISQLAPFFFPN